MVALHEQHHQEALVMEVPSTITAADAGLVPHSDSRAEYQVKDLFTP